MKSIEETISYLDEKIKYMECIRNHLGACKQIEWERDVALQQLKDAGLTFGITKDGGKYVMKGE